MKLGVNIRPMLQTSSSPLKQDRAIRQDVIAKVWNNISAKIAELANEQIEILILNDL